MTAQIPTTTSAPLSLQPSGETLLLQTAFIGDLLLSIPLLKEMRKLRPKNRFTVLCRRGLGDLLLQAGLVDEAVEISKGVAGDAGSWRAALAKLGPRHYDLIVCPHESWRSARFVGRLRASRKIGYRRWFNRFLFTDRVVRNLHLPEALRQLALLTPLDAQWSERLETFAATTRAGGLSQTGELVRVPTWADMSVPILKNLKAEFVGSKVLASASVKSREHFRRMALRGGQRIAVLAPGSVWPTKMWTPDGYAQVARDLLLAGWRVLAIGSSSERDICQRLAESVPGVLNLAGETALYESTELIAISNLVVCNDSGAMHMAAAAGTPSITIFGPTVLPFGYRPWQNDARVTEVALDCRPCGKHGSKVCPLGTHACMKTVTSEMVLRNLKALV